MEERGQLLPGDAQLGAVCGVGDSMRQAPRDQAADAARVRVAGRHIAEVGGRQIARARIPQGSADALVLVIVAPRVAVVSRATVVSGVRSEEHTSELQSLMRNSYAVFCLKKKTTQ